MQREHIEKVDGGGWWNLPGERGGDWPGTKNGQSHRVWLTDLGARVSLPLVHWKGEIPLANVETVVPPRRMSLILAVPDDGNRLLALLPSTGEPVAAVRLEGGAGQLIGAPVATAEGTIVVARQEYAESKASLLVYSLLELPRHPPSDAVSQTAPTGAASP